MVSRFWNNQNPYKSESYKSDFSHEWFSQEFTGNPVAKNVKFILKVARGSQCVLLKQKCKIQIHNTNFANFMFCDISETCQVKLALLDPFALRGTPALHLNEPADGSCCDAGLGLVWRCYWIYMSFVCLIKKYIYLFWIFEGPRLCRIQK